MSGKNGFASNGSAENVAATLRNLRRIFHAIHEASHRVNKKYGLTAPQLWALAEVGKNGGVSVSKLAEAMCIDRSVSSRLAGRLAEGRLICKKRDREDHRIVHLRITEKGRNILRRAPSPIQSSLMQGLQELRPETLRAVARGTTLLIQHMELEGTEAPFFVTR